MKPQATRKSNYMRRATRLSRDVFTDSTEPRVKVHKLSESEAIEASKRIGKYKRVGE